MVYSTREGGGVELKPSKERLMFPKDRIKLSGGIGGKSKRRRSMVRGNIVYRWGRGEGGGERVVFRRTQISTLTEIRAEGKLPEQAGRKYRAPRKKEALREENFFT